MISPQVADLLLHVTGELKGLSVTDDFWQEKPVKNPAEMNSRTLVELYRQYLAWEKDPLYREVFGEFLRVQIILGCTDGEFRQRLGWVFWFMAIYRGNHKWSERAEVFDLDRPVYDATIYRPDNWNHPNAGKVREIVPPDVAEKLDKSNSPDGAASPISEGMRS